MWKYEFSEENCAHVEVDSLFCSAFTRLAQHYYYINDLFCPEQIILEEDSSVCWFVVIEIMSAAKKKKAQHQKNGNGSH